jgi:hypothetical protein
VTHGEAQCVNDADRDPRMALIPSTPADEESLIVVPLMADGDVAGTLNVGLNRTDFDGDAEVPGRGMTRRSGRGWIRRRPHPEIVALRGRSAARSRSASPPGTATRDQRPCVVLLHNVTLSAVLM